MAGSRIKGITVEIGGDVTGLEKALQSVNSTIRTTQSQLKDVERLLKLDPTHTELLSQKQKLLADSVSATKQKLDALKTAQEQAKQQMESGDLGRDKYDALQREIIATEKELENLAREAANANTALTNIGEAGKSLENIGKNISSVGSSLTRNVTVPIVAAGTAIVKTAGDFDQSMAQVKAITGATGEDFESLRDLAIDLGAKTSYSAVECADAMTEMGKAGWSTEQILAGMSGVLDAAASSGEGLASVSTIVADAVSGFGLEAADASRVADVLAHSANAGTIDISDLGETFKYVAPMAQSMGLSLEDVTTAATAMSMAGIKGSQAGTSLRRMLTNLVKPSKSVAEAMDELGISITNEDGSFLSLNEIVDVLRDSFAGLTDDEKAYYAATIAGANGQSGLLALLNLSAEEYAKLSDEMNNCTGEAERTATVMQDNLNSKLEQLGGALESLAIKIGDIVLPKLKSLVERVTENIEKFTQAPKPVQELIVKIAAIVAAIGPVLLVIGKLTSGVGKGMQAFSSMGKGILTFVNQAKLGVGAGGKFAAAVGGISAPVIAVVAVIAVLAAAFAHLWQTNEEFRDKVTAVWDSVKAKFSEASQKITEAINSLGFDFSGLGEAIKAAWDWFCNALEPIVFGIVRNIGNVLESAIDIVTGIIQTIAGIINGFKDGDWTLFLEGLRKLWDGLWGMISSPVKYVIDVIGGYLEHFGLTWEDAWNGIKEFFTEIWNSISEFFTTTWNTIKETFESASNAVSETVTTVWESIKTKTTEIWESVKADISTAWENIQTKVSDAVNGIKDSITTGFTTAKEKVTETFNAIKEKISNVMESAKETVQSAIEAIKEKFNFTWSLPKLKLPHVSITGSFSLNPPSAPHFSIDWYRKAMADGMILNSPTIFGMKGSHLLAGGEAGSETVVGTKSLMEMIRNAVASMAEQTTVNYGGVNINLYAQPGQDIRELAYMIGDELDRKMRMAGTW